MKSGTIFDNFLITDDVKEAEDFGKETWGETKVHLLPQVMTFKNLCIVFALIFIMVTWSQGPEKKMKDKQEDEERKQREEEEKNKKESEGDEEEPEEEPEEEEVESPEEPNPLDKEDDDEDTPAKDEL